MENKKKIDIKCKGTGLIDIETLKMFQGNLKELSEQNYEKLKNSILNYGFRIPIFIWKDNIIDGHQRVFVLTKLKKEKYEVPMIPVVEIQAENEDEAKKILLLINSTFGRITYDGLYEFVQSMESIDTNKFLEEVDLANINMELFQAGYFDLDQEKLPKIDIEGDDKNVADFLVVIFNNEDELIEFKKRAGIKPNARKVEWNHLKEILDFKS